MTDWSLPGYTGLAELGTGGFGRVVLARHDQSAHVVAVKYLFDRYSADQTQRARFRHEATILRQVTSPYVARLHEFVETPDGAAIVMEAVPGVSLKHILAEHTTLTPESALTILKGSLLGLHAAHTAGTVHRDYKPANVLVQPNQLSKLVDFGIATLAGTTDHHGGTPAYMAPEQWLGHPATPATDVYAATCVFYQCVTGHRPYRATTTAELRDLHQHAPIPTDDIPGPLHPLITDGLAKHGHDRPPDAAAFLTELETVAAATYGPHWEHTGWHHLAQHATALLALSPMAAIVSATGVLTQAAGIGTAGAATASTRCSGHRSTTRSPSYATGSTS